MADTYTPNLNLIKDDQDSYYNVDKFNGNLDLIDTAVKAADDKGVAAQSATDSHKTDPAAHPNGIAGNAATATVAAKLSNFSNSNKDAPVNADSLTTNGISYTNSVGGLIGQTDGAIYSQAYDPDWQHQIFGDYRTGQVAIRGKSDGGWHPWRTVVDSGNIASQSVAHSTDAEKLKDESGKHYYDQINSSVDSWSTVGGHFGCALRAVRTDTVYPPYLIGDYGAGMVFGCKDTKGAMSLAIDSPRIKFAGTNADTTAWTMTLSGANNQNYDLSNFNAHTLDGHTADDLLRRLGGRTQPTLVPLIDWDTMKAANNGVDVRNINNAGTGIIAYGGDSNFTNGWPPSSIYLHQPYTNFDKLYIIAVDDTGTLTTTSVRETWELNQSLQKGYSTLLISNDALFWYAMSSQKNGTTDHYLSTPTLLAGGSNSQNCAIIEIYGVNY